MHIILLVVVAIFLYGCGGGESSGPGQLPANSISSAGGNLSLAGGAVILDFPAGAVSQNVAVSASVAASGGPPDPSLVRGSVYTITVSPAVTFAQPVRLTVRYDPAAAPGGIAEREFGVAMVNGAAWQSLANSTVNEADNTVTASISAAGTFSPHRIPPVASCTAAENRQFDFWIGEWDVNGIHSTITRDPAGCTIFELYRAPNTGRSISVYDATAGTWNQTYVTPQGQPIVMSGRFENGRMIMYTRLPNGNLGQRWTWERVNANTVTQMGDVTQDNGATWSGFFSGTYLRRP